MRKISFAFVLLLLFVNGYSQEIPVLKVADKPLGLSALDINVTVMGNVATTTYDMLFYNPTASVLEGELSFPLGEGHDVSRFALDVNGKLREAVVVEKELGRVAFEQVVRRGVDPALLEKGSGNTYKARIYPIPSKGYKKVVLAYEQELSLHNGAHYYNLPLHFSNKLDDFKLELTVFDQKYSPIIEKGEISGLQFSNWNKNFTTKVVKKNYIAKTPISIKIPVSVETEKVLAFENYFYVYKTITPENRLRIKPKSIVIYWDTSLSMKDRDLEKEYELLETYFAYLNTVRVSFVSFSNTIVTKDVFNIKKGDWKDLKDRIQKLNYDGGTSYNTLFKDNISFDASLLFTDGIASLSKIDLSSKNPVFIINSLNKGNHSELNKIANATNGRYVNLLSDDVKKGFLKLKQEPYKYLGYSASSKEMEVYPNVPTPISDNFSLSGRSFKSGEPLVLKFGYGTEVSHQLKILLPISKTENKSIKRIWAQKKLANLTSDHKKNKSEIIRLGKGYSLVSDYTSLIVLEDVRDYLKYQITPPEDLLDEYNKLLTFKKKNKNPLLKSSLSNGFVEVDDDEVGVPIMRMETTERRNGVEVEEEVIQAYEMEELVEVEEIMVEEIAEDLMVIPFMVVSSQPVYPGCEDNNIDNKTCFSEKINTHIDTNFNRDLENSLLIAPGRCRVNAIFTINNEGYIVNIRVRSSNSIVANEVKRILQLLPQMIPGKQTGRRVPVSYALPILFSINDNGQVVDDSATVIVTGNLSNNEIAPKKNNFKKYAGSLIIKDRTIIAKYLSELKSATNIEEAYLLYLKQRNEYLSEPSYFIDVSNYLKKRFNDYIYSARILSNIPEHDFDNYELLKVFAYQLEQNNQHDLALFVFKQILYLRPEDAQSYRDLALAHQQVGECQQALDLWNSIVTGAIYKNKQRRIFKGIEDISKIEIKRLIQEYKAQLDISKISKELKTEVNYDLRITVDWNHNDTDIDLHIIDPNLEECFYSHNKTSIGGELSQDMTQGFGPEEFTLENAIKGAYYVKVKYYGDRYQKVENPTFMKITMYKNYGSKKESKEIKLIRLTKKDNEELLAKLEF